MNSRMFTRVLASSIEPFHCRPNKGSSLTRQFWGMWHMHYKSHLKINWTHCRKNKFIVPLGIYKISEWCRSFVLVPKSNGKERPCLNPARLNQSLSRPVHRGLTTNDIFPKPTHVHYHNIKLDDKSSYIITFAYQFGRYRCARLPLCTCTFWYQQETCLKRN